MDLIEWMNVIAPALGAVMLAVVFKVKAKAACPQPKKFKPADDPRLGSLGLPPGAKYKPKLQGWDSVVDAMERIDAQISAQENARK